ncbi:acetyl-CoA/propionyl-CoA carboxylase biotin carboxyl carrier protein [Pseudonocardia sediminis]|uniref:Acetyl-CoA/propionyl-CoA carboxylase biotin carboxyl carrier protein n=1 Tax=Pseudonocardia sediminis TaxID=1397368 RepID=A0A4Q7URN1_PSEST|nr:biotin carboxylase N-terminal domain-containing protein [Pseudonocardia sediminis]RZT84507.1 acetyl-CoA/propionyl-CoA carboxylase biotin carboxyl carrier protein [Pseudonocardia sediminis]
MADRLGIRTVLVANRGEIAVRIVRACRELGLRAVAVYSDADADALHVRLADDAHRIGPAPARQSYLDIDALLDAAKTAGADAVHPGYGLLSEDAGFAAAVVAAGMAFVGPSPEVIARMGDKVAARAVAVACDVPVPPGTGALDVDDRDGVIASAEEIGWPLVVKASFGGGGRGMRVVQGLDGLDDALAAAGREAAAAFGRSEVHLERYLERPRHVEVQVLGDTHGTVLALGDRDCSVQRRHQKLIEEAPAPDLSPDLRAAITDAALRIARDVGYTGAGTVEFLVADDAHYFLEMNTRLQVEHGVTELVTGVDLVAEQLRIADGRALTLTPGDVTVRGHAIEARIAAEDPALSFRPSPGRIGTLTLPTGPGLRVDTGLESGGSVAAEYDSMFAKVLAHGPDRDTARRRLSAALGELRVDGIATTAPYLRAVLDQDTFTTATHDTGSVEREWDPATLLANANDTTATTAAGAGPGATAGAPSGARSGAMPGHPATNGSGPAAAPGPGASNGAATGADGDIPARRVRIATDRGPVEIEVYGRPIPAGRQAGTSTRRSRTDDDRAAATAGGPGGPPTAPMDATVIAVRVEPGQEIAAGDVVVVLEAMKMEMEIRSEIAGTVRAVPVTPGASVPAGTVLVEVVTR